MSYENDISRCLDVLNAGGIILYPTDTIWGIGCDATNQKAVNRIFALKQREETKSMIILVADINSVAMYADDPGAAINQYLSECPAPTTVIYAQGKNVAPGLINKDGTLAIRLVKDGFCKELISSLKKPVVSTSANISGDPSPAIFKEVSEQIKKGVDFVVQHRQGDTKAAKPSSIIRVNEKNEIIVIRP